MVASSRLDIVNLIEWMDGLFDIKKFQHIKKEVVLELKMEMLDKAMEKRDVSEGEYMWWCEILKKEFESLKKKVPQGVLREGIYIDAPPRLREAEGWNEGRVQIRVDEIMMPNGARFLCSRTFGQNGGLLFDVNAPHNIVGRVGSID